MAVPAIVGQVGQFFTSPRAMTVYGTTAKVAGLALTCFIGAFDGVNSKPARQQWAKPKSTLPTRILGAIATLAAYKISGFKGAAFAGVAFGLGHLITYNGKDNS